MKIRKNKKKNQPLNKKINFNKNRDNDVNIDTILEEAKFLSESKEIEKNALKFKNKSKMEEIFSNTSHEHRLVNTNPLDEEEAKTFAERFPDVKAVQSNEILDDHTAITMEAERLMDKPNEKQFSQTTDTQQTNGEIQEQNFNSWEEKFGESAKIKKAQPNSETQAVSDYNRDKLPQDAQPQDAQPQAPIVRLKPEYEKGTTIAKDIIEDVEQFNVKPLNIKEFDTIDIDLENENHFETVDSDSDKQQENRTLDDFRANDIDNTEDNLSNYERIFGKPKPVTAEVQTIVSKVPVYVHESKVEKIQVKAGKFSEVVFEEYEQYIKSANPVISQVNKSVQDPDNLSVKAINEKFVGKVVDFFANEGDDNPDTISEEDVVTVDDYTSEEDAKSILFETNANIRKLFIRTVLMGIVSAIALALTFVLRVVGGDETASQGAAPIVFCVTNFALIAISVILCRVTVLNGLSPLIKFKGNSDTAVALASIGAILQCIISVFYSEDFFMGVQSYFAVIVILGFFANAFGKLLMVTRVKENFKFITANLPKYSAKIYTNESVASKLMSGTIVNKPIIAYQHETKFLSNFLKLSYAPDPSEDMASKLAPFSAVISLLSAVAYGVLNKNIVEAISVYALMSAVSIPICTLLCANIPMRSLCKKLLKKNVMLCGYPGVKQFCDTKSVMVDACELYPKGKVMLNGIKPFVKHKIDNSILAAAAIMQEANSPLASIFTNLLRENKKIVPAVESVMYEDTMGLVGWVNSERILVGTYELMEKYSVRVPSRGYEDRYIKQDKQVTYIAQAGELIAMFITTYEPAITIAQELQRAENSGISILVRTTDPNITSEQIADNFGVFYRTVKVLPTGLANVCKEAVAEKEDSSRAYLATRGGFRSLLMGLSNCVQIKGNISLAVVIELIAVIFGLVLVAVICLYSGVAAIKTVEILLFVLFWAAAAILAPLIKKIS